MNARNGGGTYDTSFPWRICLHTIEGSLNLGVIAGHAYPPQVWYDPATRRIVQTVPLERAGFALERPSGAPETNKARCLQVEISGSAQTTPDWPVQWLDNLAEDIIVPFCRFVASQGGQIDLLDVAAPGAIPGSASETAAQRMSDERWRTFRGVCGHRHVPRNSHWDPGALDVYRIAAHAAFIVGAQLVDTGQYQPDGTPIEDDDMAVIVRLTAPGDAQDGMLFVTDGVTKCAVPSMDVADEMIKAGMARKQPDGSLWANVSMATIRTPMTVDEWGLAGLPGRVAEAVRQVSKPAAGLS